MTELQILRLVEYVTVGFNANEVTEAVSLDVAKAFGRVWHNELVVKILHFGYPVGLVKLVRSFNAGNFERRWIEPPWHRAVTASICDLHLGPA